MLIFSLLFYISLVDFKILKYVVCAIIRIPLRHRFPSSSLVSMRSMHMSYACQVISVYTHTLTQTTPFQSRINVSICGKWYTQTHVMRSGTNDRTRESNRDKRAYSYILCWAYHLHHSYPTYILRRPSSLSIYIYRIRSQSIQANYCYYCWDAREHMRKHFAKGLKGEVILSRDFVMSTAQNSLWFVRSRKMSRNITYWVI